jgi:hypothetical protein
MWYGIGNIQYPMAMEIGNGRKKEIQQLGTGL